MVRCRASCCLRSRRIGQKYRQEYKKGEAEDNGEVLATNHLVEVKAGRYKSVAGHHGHEQPSRRPRWSTSSTRPA